MSLTLVGCGGSNKSASSNAAIVEEFEELSELQSKLSKHTVICTEGYCPGSIAKLAFWGKAEEGKYYLGVCSGTLYNNKYIITNSHCIPDELRYANANCSKQISVIFPDTAFLKNEKANCSRIVQVFDINNNEPDIAVIELNRNVIREDIKISKNAFVENSTVKAYTMDPSYENEGTVGKIRLKTCQMTTDNIFTMSNDSKSATTMLTGNSCNVIGGNSGSGLFNARNEYIGTVYAKIEMADLRSIFSQAKISNSMFSYNGSAYNIGCLNNITENSGFDCDMSSKSMSDLDNYIEREKAANGLTQEDESKIKYQVLDGFKLKLTLSKDVATTESLVYFKEIWKKLFVSPSSSQKLAQKRLIEAQ